MYSEKYSEKYIIYKKVWGHWDKGPDVNFDTNLCIFLFPFSY